MGTSGISGTGGGGRAFTSTNKFGAFPFAQALFLLAALAMLPKLIKLSSYRIEEEPGVDECFPVTVDYRFGKRKGIGYGAWSEARRALDAKV